MTYLPVNTRTAYLNVSETFPLEPVDLREKLNFIYSLIANATNLRDISQYENVEVINGQQYFTSGNPQKKRQVYRKVINFGALPNAATKSVAHGITLSATSEFTRIYATATQPNTSFLPIPYASAADSIELSVDMTNVNITTVSNRTAYTICYVVLEYIK